MIEFAGISSDDKYVVVEQHPRRIIPKRKYTVQPIPGRSGDLYIEEADDAFENYDQQYTVFLDAKAPGLSLVSRGLAEWLLGSTGYQRLEDSYDPDFYRMAVVVGGSEFVNIFNEYGRGTLTFNCAPKRFFKSGEKEISLTYGQKVYSPSVFGAKPIVKIQCNSFNVENAQPLIRFTDRTGAYKNFALNVQTNLTAIIDSERHTATLAPLGTDINNKVLSDYENLYLDSVTTVTWNQYVSGVTIIPRWWTI